MYLPMEVLAAMCNTMEIFWSKFWFRWNGFRRLKNDFFSSATNLKKKKQINQLFWASFIDVCGIFIFSQEKKLFIIWRYEKSISTY